MRLRFMAVALLFCLASASPAQQQLREEEIIVRTAYAKLSYSDEVRIVLDALQNIGRDKLWKTRANLVDRDLDSRLNFELSHFEFGKISAIADRKIGEFDGSPTQIGGEILDVTPSIYNYRANGSPSQYVAYVKFAWKTSPYPSLWPAESWPVSKALQSEQFEGKKYTDYVTYTVTATFQNKSRTYSTWMLFGRDEKSKPQVYFMDGVADPTAVVFAYEHSMYPAAFVETDLRTVPFVDKWLYENARACNAKSEKDNDRIDVCCDPESGRCGVAESLLAPRNSRRALPAGKQPKLMPASFHISSLPLRPIMQTSTGCSQFTVNTTFPHGLGDVQEHNSGQHNFTATVVGSCTYTDGAIVPGPCNVKCTAESSSVISDFGSLSGLVFQHATAKTDATGGDFSNGGSTAISCLGISAGTVRSCTTPCSTNISINLGGKGNIGATVNFPSSAIWNDQNQGQMMCQPQTSDISGASGCDPTATTDFGTVQDQPTNCDPVVLDLGGLGDRFALTDSANGVKFDIRATGHRLQVPWTAKDSGTAFLVLDRNHNGVIDDGTELFSNVTPQLPSSSPNGFKALAQYDRPEFGGNVDGVLDSRDAIFSSLRLWIDANHDGLSQPQELHTLAEMGVSAISLSYQRIERRDENGNIFLFRANVQPGRDTQVSHMAYDVFFVTPK
jgi:hypothetical protein